MSRKEPKERINPKTDLKKYPNDFRELNNLVQPTTEESIDSAEEQIVKNKFFNWLNQESSTFSEAKHRMINQGLILPNDFIPKTTSDFANKYALEYTCTCLTHYFLENDAILRQVPASKERHARVLTAMKFINKELKTIGALPFENSVMQHIFQISLEALLMKDNRSIYSAGKVHPFIARELFTKRMLEALYMHYIEHNLTDNFIIEVALDIADQFFYSRMASDPKDLAFKIKTQVIEQKQLTNMSVMELLSLSFSN